MAQSVYFDEPYVLGDWTAQHGKKRNKDSACKKCMSYILELQYRKKLEEKKNEATDNREWMEIDDSSEGGSEYVLKVFGYMEHQISQYEMKVLSLPANTIKKTDLFLGENFINAYLTILAGEANSKRREDSVGVFVSETLLPMTCQNLFVHLSGNKERSGVERNSTIQTMALEMRKRIMGMRTGASLIFKKHDLVLVPINTGGIGHWTLGVIDNLAGRLHFYDSSWPNGNAGQQRVQTAKEMLSLIGDCYNPTANVSSYEWATVNNDAWRQTDGWSCGYHLLMYAEMVIRSSCSQGVIEGHDMSQNHVETYRRRLITKIQNLESLQKENEHSICQLPRFLDIKAQGNYPVSYGSEMTDLINCGPKVEKNAPPGCCLS